MKALLIRVWRPLALAVGVGVFAYLLGKIGISTVVEHLREIGPAFLLMPATALVGLFVRGLAILPLLRPAARMSVGAALASRMAATALNLTIAFGVGGEAARLLWFRPERRQEAVSAIILDGALLILADLLYLLVAVAAALLWLALPRNLEWLALAIAALSLAVAAGLIWVTARMGISVRFINVLRRLGFKSMAHRLPDAQAVDATLRSLWSDRPRSVLYALAIQFASRLFLAAEIWVGLWLLRVPATPVEALTVSAAPIAANAVFTFIPSQLGVQEGSIGLFFAAVGLSPETGLVLGVIQRIGQLILIPIGLVALAAAPRKARRELDRRPREFG